MPGIPPYARKEKISDYIQKCHGIEWREDQTQTADGAMVKLCIAESEDDDTKCVSSESGSPTVYILYFQGNAGSIPKRLPLISPIIKSLSTLEDGKNGNRRYTVLCLSYRGYWTSQNRRPSEKGLMKDASAAVSWIVANESRRNKTNGLDRTPVVFWGQSLGCGVATNCAAQHFRSQHLELRALILETPFTNVRDMLVALYPQKWLPYRYLYPFL